MIILIELFSAFLTALMMENLLFARAIDIPGLYEKRTPKQIISIGSILTGIISVSSIPAYFLNGLFKNHTAFAPFTTLSFLLLNIVVFLLFYYGLKKWKPSFFESVQTALPFYGINCSTLGTLLIAARLSANIQFIPFFGYCLGSGVSMTAAMLVIWSIRQSLSLTRVPKSFRGLPITLIYLGIVSLALFGLLGNQLPA